jgi:hypothetical protein
MTNTNAGSIRFAIVAAVAALVTAFLPSVSVRAQTPASAMWVPVIADYQEVSSRGIERVWHYWRDQNGSIRVETGRSVQTLDVIHIQNVARAEVYEYKTDIGWRSAHLSPSMSLTPVREISASGGTVTTVSVEGRTAIRRTLPDGQIEVFVPELNFLLVERTRADGRRQLLRSVRVEAQIPATLFAPPRG